MSGSVSGAIVSAYVRQETTYGTYPSTAWTDANSWKIHLSKNGLVKDKVYAEDPALLGNTYKADMIPTASKFDGSIGFSLHPEQLGWWLYYGLGQVKDTKYAPAGSIVVMYTGAQESCLIGLTGTNLTSKIGATGSESSDAAFGTAGTIDISSASFDTLTELSAVIDGYADYTSYVINGGTSASTLITPFAEVQAKKQSVKLEAINDAYIVITYIGASASCLIAKSGNNLTAKKGTLGAESADTDFGTAGTIDLSSSSFDTLTELAAEINGYTSKYTATVIKGGTFDPADIVDFTDTQAKVSGGLTLEAKDSTRVAYRHRFIPNTVGTTKPSFSLRSNQDIENIAYSGCKIGEFSLDISPRALIVGEASLVAKMDQLVSALTGITTEAQRSFISSNVKIYFDAVQSLEVKKVSLKNNPNLDKEDTIVGSEYIAEPSNQQAQCTLETDLRYNSTTLPLKNTTYENGQELEIVLYGEGYDSIETNIKYSFWARLPRCKITACKAEISGAGKIIMPATFEVMTPLYNSFDAIEWDVITSIADYTLVK